MQLYFTGFVLSRLLVAGCGGANNPLPSTQPSAVSRTVSTNGVSGTFRYTLTMKDPFVKGEPVTATFTVKNLTEEPIVRYITGPTYFWTITRGEQEV